QVVPHARDVGGDLDLARQPDAGHLAQRRVRLLGRGRVDARAHTTALRALLERRRLVLRHLVLPALADQLLDRGQPSLRLPVVFLLSAPRTGPGPAAFRLSGGESEFRRFPAVSTRSTCAFPLSADPRGRACRAWPLADGEPPAFGRRLAGLAGQQPTP